MNDSVRRVGMSTHRRSSTSTMTGAVLGGLDEEVPGGQGDGERLDRLRRALHRQRRADRGRACRRQLVEAAEHAVEQGAEARPGQLQLGFDTVQPDHADLRLVEGDQRSGSVEEGGLADAGLADDGQPTALAGGGPAASCTMAVDGLRCVLVAAVGGGRWSTSYGREHGVSPMRERRSVGAE